MSATIDTLAEMEERIRELAERQGELAEGRRSESRQSISPVESEPTVLLTGFEPWQEYKTNPSQQIAQRLHGETIGGAQVVSLTCPVVFGEDTARIFPAITDLKPRLVLMLGLSAGTPCIDVERFGVNLRISDSDPGTQQEIIPGGPGAYLATIDVERITQAIRGVGVPARAHGYAGSFLCNHVMYQTLHFAKTNSLTFKAGFLHLPQSSEQAIAENRQGQPSLPLDSMIRGVRVAIEEALL